MILGIDPSITSSGLVVLHNGNVELAVSTINKAELTIYERVKTIYQQINGIVTKTPFDLVVIEGFSFNSKSGDTDKICYLGHRIREGLEENKKTFGTPWIEVPPTSLKKFVCNNGNAKKELMLKEVYKRWKFDTDVNDIADAYGLAKFGMAYLGQDSDLYAYQIETIDSLRNPKPAKKPRKKVK